MDCGYKLSSIRFTNGVTTDTKNALDHLVSGSMTGFVIIGQDKKLEYINDIVCTTLGYSSDEMLGSDFLEYVHPESRDSIDAIFKQRVAGNDFIKIYNAKIQDKAGNAVDVQICSTAIEMDRETIKIIAQVLDQTDVESNRRALASMANKHQTLVETMNEGLGVIDNDGKIIFANSALLKLAGYEGSSLLGMPISELLHGLDMETVISKVSQRREGVSDRYETSLMHSTGRKIPVMISASPMYDSENNYSGSISVFTDLSNIYNGQKQVQQIFNAFSDPAFLWKRQENGEIILEMFNKPLLLLSKRAASDCLGNPLTEIFGQSPELVSCIQQVFEDGKRIRIEAPFEAHPGPKRWFIWDFIRHSEDSVLMIAIDITHRMKSEKSLQEMNDRALFYLDLLQHDMRNKLQEIQGYAELARDEMDDETRIKFMNSAISAVETCTDLISKTSVLEKLMDLPLNEVSLSDSILEALKDFKDIEKVVNLKISGPIIKANELLKDVFSFLIGNMCKRNHSETIRLWVEFHEREDHYDILLFDNGPVIPESQVRNIFNPLKRFGDRVELIIGQQIIERYGGKINVRNNTARFGIPRTEFCIQFPKIQ